jgi:hypothetical protein
MFFSTVPSPLLLFLSSRVGDYVRANLPEFKWDFKDLFFSIATRVGSSDRLHTDWGDYRYGGIAFVLTLTEWKAGGDIELPQLGVSVRPVPGDVLCFQAGRLLHAATTPEGERVVLTFFTDNGLFANAAKY